jgi:hypothetical protein
MSFNTMRGVLLSGLTCVLLGCAGSNIVQTAEGPMPEYCLQNNTAQGAAIGGLVGGGVGALAGGQRGAVAGALVGATFGGLTGAQADAKCRQVALRNMAQRALEAHAAATARGIRPPQSYGTLKYVTPSNKKEHEIRVVRVTELQPNTVASSRPTAPPPSSPAAVRSPATPTPAAHAAAAPTNTGSCVDLDDGMGGVEKVCKVGATLRRATPAGELLEDIT